jgi:hypothetical protein
MAPPTQANSRVYAGLVVLTVLIIANVVVHVYRYVSRSGSATPVVVGEPVFAPPTPGGGGPLSQTSSGSGQIGVSGPAGASGTSPAVAENVANPTVIGAGEVIPNRDWTLTLTAIREQQEKVKKLPPMLHIASLAFSPDGVLRNPFGFEVVIEPEPDEGISATSTPVVPPVPYFSGSFELKGQRYALIRYGSEMFLVKEHEMIPRSGFQIISIASTSAMVRNSSGEKQQITHLKSQQDGLIKALLALQGNVEKRGFPLHGPAHSSPNTLASAPAAPTLAQLSMPDSPPPPPLPLPPPQPTPAKNGALP